MPLPSQRPLFDVPPDVAYFNCASMTPQLKAATERLVAAAAGKARPWTRVAADSFRDVEAMRKLFAEALGADAEGYAVVPSASYGIATAARMLEPTLAPGDAIVTMREEFPSVVLAFRRLAKERGAALEIVDVPADGDWTSAIASRIRAGVKIVAVSPCHWTNGAPVDLVRIAHAARGVGAALVVDATQTLGAIPFDFDAIQPDFVAAAGYKWLLMPYGVSMLYVAPRWREGRPLEEAWLAREGADDFASLVAPSDRYAPGARRFDMGEKANALLPGAIAGLEQLRAWGVPSIAPTLAGINARIVEVLSRFGFRIASPESRCPHLFGAEAPERLGSNVAAALAAHDVFISRRGRSLRFSPHLHVNDADIGRLEQALRELAS